MAEWSFVVGPWNGGAQYELPRARARKLTANLAEPSTATFQISGRDPRADEIEELITDLHILRRPRPGVPAQRLYRGRVGPTQDSIDADKHTISVPTADYREVLNRRILWSNSLLSWMNTDQNQIAAGLIWTTQNSPGSALNMTVTPAFSGIIRDRAYEPGDSVGQRIQELSEVIDGFDWDVLSPTDTELKLTIWHPERGANRGVVLELGGLAAEVTRNVPTDAYASAVRVTGQQPENEAGYAPTPVEIDPGDLSTNPPGRWDKVVGTSITTQDALDDRADWLLDQAQIIRPSYTVRLRAGGWRGPDHIWLGDTCRLVVMSRPRLQVDALLRVQTVDIDIGDDGQEDIVLTLAWPKPSFSRRQNNVEDRLLGLEKRSGRVIYGAVPGSSVEGNDPRVVADQAAGTASIRTLGSGAQQAAPGSLVGTVSGIGSSLAATDNVVANLRTRVFGAPGRSHAPVCILTATGDRSLPDSTNVWQDTQWAVTLDTDSIWHGGTVGGGGGYMQVPVNGFYRILFRPLVGGVGNSHYAAKVVGNSTSITTNSIASDRTFVVSGAAEPDVLHAESNQWLAAGDSLRFSLWQGGAGATGTCFGGWWGGIRTYALLQWICP